MVSAPKSLHDLRRVEAAVRVTCRACGAIGMIDREELIAERLFGRKTLDWSLVRRDLPCGSCASKDVDVAGVPFAQDGPELRRRRTEAALLNLALQVLNNAAQRSRQEDVQTPAVRLALRVLHPYLGDQALLTTFWTSAAEDRDRPWGGAHQAMRWIVVRLLDRKQPVWAEFR